MHKVARKVSAAIRGTAGGTEYIKKMMKLYRFTRGPFKTSKFGQLVSDARTQLLDILQKDPNHPVLEPWLSGMSHDADNPLHPGTWDPCGFNRADAIKLLASQKGVSIASSCKG